MVYSLLRVVQDFDHQPHDRRSLQPVVRARDPRGTARLRIPASELSFNMWVVVKIRVPFFGVLIIIRHLILGYPKRGHNFCPEGSFRKLGGYLVLGGPYNRDPTI